MLRNGSVETLRVLLHTEYEQLREVVDRQHLRGDHIGWGDPLRFGLVEQVQRPLTSIGALVGPLGGALTAACHWVRPG